ncbi:MAG: hypothetical protein LCH57_04135 [Proteobacteria bacterium]|nr:hypothetical protein [Pseudomonadota bacterium]
MTKPEATDEADNDVTYWLTTSEEPRLRLSGTEFRALAGAAEGLEDLYDVEDAYEVVIGNYLDLERQLFDGVLTGAVRGAGEMIDAIAEQRREAHRRFANVLNSVRFLTHMTEHKASAHLKPAERDEFLSLKSAEYDANLAFRAMEKLRNHSQHHGFAVGGVTHGLSNEEWRTNGPMIRTSSWSLQPDRLAGTQGWSVAMVEELKAHAAANDGVNLTVFMRSYMASWSRLMAAFRRIFAPLEEEWSRTLTDAAARMVAGGCRPDRICELSAVAEAGEIERDRVWLGDVVGDRLKLARRRNGKLGPLDRARFVT